MNYLLLQVMTFSLRSQHQNQKKLLYRGGMIHPISKFCLCIGFFKKLYSILFTCVNSLTSNQIKSNQIKSHRKSNFHLKKIVLATGKYESKYKTTDQRKKLMSIHQMIPLLIERTTSIEIFLQSENEGVDILQIFFIMVSMTGIVVPI
jgi:hypothetical protein